MMRGLLTSDEIWALPITHGKLDNPDDCGRRHNWLYTMQSTAVGEMVVGAFCSRCGIWGLPKKIETRRDE